VADIIAVPREAFEKLVKRTMALRYPPHKELTEEQVARHFRYLEFACTVNPVSLVEDVMDLLDRLEAKEKVNERV
jgi:hypothetical protein